jgi:ribosome-binding factor A
MTNPRSRARIEARIQERVAYCIAFELADPRASFITVTKVEITDDLLTARVFYSVLGTRGDRSRVEHMLASATGFIRKQVGRVLKTRFIPDLKWIYDDSAERAAEVQQKIHEALEKDRAINPAAHAELPRPKGSKALDDVEREYREFLQAQEDEEGESKS